MTQINADRESEFQQYLTSTANYFAKVEAEGDTPWFRDPVKLAKLRITATDPIAARRELYMRRYERKAAA